MSQDEYESLIETLDVLADEEAMADLRESEEDVQAGRVFDWEEVKRDLRLARLVLTGRARGQFASLPATLQDAVKETLADLAVEPKGVGKPLPGRLAGVWAARVGNYRVLYTIEEPGGSQWVVVRSILHRAVAHGRKRRR